MSLHARLSALVARDAARRHGVVLLVIVLVAGWLERAWPMTEVRTAAWQASPEGRAIVLALVHLAWSLATHGAASQLVLSRRLELFRSLPRSPGWWRRFHALHLIVLDAAVAGVTAYGVLPMPTLSAIGWIACIVSLSLALRTFAIVSRGAMRAVAIAAHLGVITILLAYVPVAGALALSCVLAAVALVRLGHPLPEPGPSGRSWRLGRRLGGRLGRMTLAGLHLRALVRLRPLLVVALVGAMCGLAVLVGIGWQHTADDEPAAARSLVHGTAWCIAALASIALPTSRSLVAADLTRIDAWPVSPRATAWALVCVAAAPTLGVLVVLSLGPVPWTEWLPVSAAAIAACATSCVHTHASNTARRGDARRFAIRWSITVAAGAFVAVVAWPMLIAWALALACMLPSTIARADAIRRRFALGPSEHDHG